MKRGTIPTICGVCDAGCGVNVRRVDGKIVRQSPLENHPFSTICPRGARAEEVIYSEDRLLYPQRRIGERGEGLFEANLRPGGHHWRASR
ncbi:MAG: hypothetical protein GY866_27025 [Proteobacteria bacterium]|nr:hypothetical protein [Pseudomonadota bacterium]